MNNFGGIVLRLRKKPHTDEKLQTFSNFVITEKIGEEFKGTWRKIFDENNLSRELHVELGTGKGDFITQLAEKNPDKNFIGLEVEAGVVLKAARKIQEKNLSNIRLVVFDINRPWPKKRHAKRRLTHVRFLEMYKKILKPDGQIFFKTDNRGLFDFSLEQFELANYKVSDVTFDLHANEPPDNIRTEYETKFSSLGVPINRLVANL